MQVACYLLLKRNGLLRGVSRNRQCPYNPFGSFWEFILITA